MNIFILLVVAICANLIYSADSDGKDFVFNFMHWEDYNGAITTSVIAIPSYNDSVCTFKYTQKSDNKVVSIQKKFIYGKTNEFSFDPKEVLLEVTFLKYEFQNNEAIDFRIFASCTEEVKLIGKFLDPYNDYGSIFLIYSTANAGNKYTFSMPTAFTNVKGYITILPFTEEESFEVNTIGYSNGELFSQQKDSFNTSIGQYQHYISISPLSDLADYTTSVTISSTSKFMIMYMTPFASTSNKNDGSCGTLCETDYISFMPMPLVSEKCLTILSKPDQRMITNDFTTRLYISPPDVSSDCNEVFTLNVYDQNNNVTGIREKISNIALSTIDLTKKYEIATSTRSGNMPMYRLGSILNHPDTLTAYGHFAHYVPSIQEWVSGNTQFYTLAKDCSLEMYTDLDGDIANLITLDGIPLSKYTYTSNYMNYFNKRFSHIIIVMKGYGIHNIQNNGNYVLYVACKNVLGAFSAAGYLTGFNQIKS